MPEMPDHDLRTVIDALCARLQTDLHAQAAQVAERHCEEREATRRESEAKTAELVSARVDAVREEWQSRLQSGLTDAAADAERRLAAEADRSRVEIDALTAAAAEAAVRHRAELDALRDEWQGRLQAGLADAAADADRRLMTETDRLRRELEEAAAASIARARDEVRQNLERAAAESTAQLRAELEQAATHSTAQLREEMEQAAVHAVQATTRLREEMELTLAAERERASTEISTERTRLQGLLESERQRAGVDIEAERARAQAVGTERDRSAAELEAEKLKVQALTAALEEAQTQAAAERESARSAAASLLDAQNEQRASDAQAVVEARVAERQTQLAVVERLLSAVRTIDSARSLSDTLSNLTEAAASVAPRAALFIVSGVSGGVSGGGDGGNGKELQGWKAAGFAGQPPIPLRLLADDHAGRGVLDLALTTGRAVSTATAPAPTFASLPPQRAGLAVPITVGGQSVAVLYADDAPAAEPEAPASWPEAIQVLAAHASSCLAQITALRTTQAMQQMSGAGTRLAGGSAAPAPGSEEDSSARRYARLLVSEIKLYNETAVRTGREKRDLLERLAPEIERARRLYEERVSPSVGGRTAYFQQELVHTLADGDSALLGGHV